ncbi:MAG: single-stranded-DNA-specific exonuclease RecJ [Anaerovoracaceae bacterium]|jgi:single-stranded-DNA-specific exonuclease
MKKKWIFPAQGFYEKDTEEIHPVLFDLLKNRGIENKEAMQEFLDPRPKLTYDPFAMKGMREAALLILDAIEQGKRICVYGDYDADGVCASTLMMEILSELSADVFYYIPSRFEEGYGLNMSAISAISQKGARVIVTVDCGSTSIEELKYAKKLGIEIVVTDHHNMDEGNGKTADCILVNPKRVDCGYPDPNLSGCGVAFKLAQALQRMEIELKGRSAISKTILNGVLDLVAIATIGDIVPLMGENRTLVKYGMEIINRGNRPGLAKLIKDTGLKPGEISCENVAYVIVPHLNAAGRLLSADKAVTLLISKEEGEINAAVAELIESNRERRRIQEEATEKVIGIIKDDGMESEFLLIYAPFVHEGIAGIVAGKIKDAFYRPAIILTAGSDGLLKGTGRSIEGVDLYRLLSCSKDLFVKFGGHEGACGFSMKEQYIPMLKRNLNYEMDKIIENQPELLIPKIHIDRELEGGELSIALVKEIERLAPFGHMNPSPVFCIRKASITGLRYMGEHGQHVSFCALGVECILFNRGDEYEKILKGQDPADLAGELGINRWNNKEKIQFVIRDIQ